MLAVVARNAVRLEALAPRLQARALSDRVLSDRERAAEAVYFQKEERELLKKIAKKMGM